MNHTIDTEDKKVEDPGPLVEQFVGRVPRTSYGPVGGLWAIPLTALELPRQSAGRKAEKKRK